MKNDIQRSLGQLEGTIKTGFDAINKRLDKINGTIEKHDDKINNLETFKDNIEGKIGIIGTIASFIGAFITMLFNYFIRNR